MNGTIQIITGFLDWQNNGMAYTGWESININQHKTENVSSNLLNILFLLDYKYWQWRVHQYKHWHLEHIWLDATAFWLK